MTADVRGGSAAPAALLSRFAVTFGQQYRKITHPRAVWVHPDGYLDVWAPSYDAARGMAFSVLGKYWSDLYPLDEIAGGDLFPLGTLATIRPVHLAPPPPPRTALLCPEWVSVRLANGGPALYLAVPCDGIANHPGPHGRALPLVEET